MSMLQWQIFPFRKLCNFVPFFVVSEERFQLNLYFHRERPTNKTISSVLAAGYRPVSKLSSRIIRNDTELQANFSFSSLVLVVPHSLTLMHIICSVHWGGLCVGPRRVTVALFPLSSVPLPWRGQERPDTVEPRAWVWVLATHSVWPACSMPLSPLGSHRHPHDYLWLFPSFAA